MRRVSVKVAKAIKESGYPLIKFQTVSREQFESGFGYKYFNDENFYSESPSILYPEDNNTIDMYFCPTYIDVWLWLWQENKIYIDIAHYYNSDEITIWDNNYNKLKSIDCFNKYTNPEEAIAQAIEYLVDNNLIK